MCINFAQFILHTVAFLSGASMTLQTDRPSLFSQLNHVELDPSEKLSAPWCQFKSNQQTKDVAVRRGENVNNRIIITHHVAYVA